MTAQMALKPSDPQTRLTEALVTSLRRRQVVGSRNIALATAQLCHTVVRSAKFTTIDELLALVKAVGRKLVEANPKELAAGNIIRQILRLIREEYRAAMLNKSNPPSVPETPFLGLETPGLHAPSGHYLSGDFNFTSSPSSSSAILPTSVLNRQTSLSNFVAMRHSRAQLERGGSVLDLPSSTGSLFMNPLSPVRGNSMEDLFSIRKDSGDDRRKASEQRAVFLQAIEEVIGGLEDVHDEVAKEARDHIHSSEVILTMGYSKTVEACLKQAYRNHKFTVIVAQSAPSYQGHEMARALSSHSIPVLLVPDSSLHALMPRITKVILGAHTVLANGGLFALSGSLAISLAAQAHSKPVIIATGQYKFAPAWNLYHEYGAVDFQSPGEVIGFDGDGGGGGIEGVEVVAPMYDYIRPELINVFVTNEGDHSPSYIYRIIKDAYDNEDIEL